MPVALSKVGLIEQDKSMLERELDRIDDEIRHEKDKLSDLQDHRTSIKCAIRNKEQEIQSELKRMVDND